MDETVDADIFMNEFTKVGERLGAEIIFKKKPENLEKATSVLEQLLLFIKKGKTEQEIVLSVVPVVDRIKAQDEMLKLYRGKKYIGLPVATIKEFNERLKGLRGMDLLAAAPNVGKTALTVQLALESLIVNNDACLIYLSGEMTAEEIFTRMNLYLSGLNYDTFVLGGEKVEGEDGTESLFTEGEVEKIKKATSVLKTLGDRLQIIGPTEFREITASAVIKYIEQLKEKTKCSRAIVVVDYLQVWPTTGQRFSSDIEADKWRIGEIKKIKEALAKTNQDPVLVISEARKPSEKGEIWGGDMSDVMGSARGSYSPDLIMLVSQLQPIALKKLWDLKKLPVIPVGEEHENISGVEEKAGTAITAFLADIGISIVVLKVPKCRDGMKRFTVLLQFHIYKNKFEPIDWGGIGKLVEQKKQTVS